MSDHSFNVTGDINRGLVEILLQESDVGILVINPKGTIQFANPAAGEIFDASIDNLVGSELGLPALNARSEFCLLDKRRLVIEARTRECYYNGQDSFLVFLRDITEIVHAQEALEESRNRFTQLFDHAINGFALCEVTNDETGHPVDFIMVNVNQAFVNLLGLKQADIIGKSVSGAIPGVMQTPAWNALFEVAKTGESQRVDFFSDIFNRYFDISLYQPVEGRVAAILSEITDEVQTQRALQDSEKKFRQLFENALNGFALHEIILDKHGKPVNFRFLNVNDAFTAYTGIKSEDAIGRKATDVLPGIEETDLIDRYGQVALTGEAQRFETYYESLDRHYLIIAYSPQKGQFATVFLDNSERVRMEHALQESERRYRQLFEHAIFGFALQEMVYDEDGEPQDFIFVEVNDAFGEHTGLDSNELEGKTASEVLPRARETGLIETHGEIDHSGVPIQFDYFSPDLDRYFHISSFSPQKGIVASSVSNITDRIYAEKKLRQSEAKYRTLFELMSQGVIYQNAQGEIINANPAAEHILGLTLAEMQGRTSTDPEWKAIRMNGEELPGEEHPAMIALRTGRVIEGFIFGVYNPRRKEHVWISVSAIPEFQNHQDKPFQVFTTFTEITDQVRVQHALEERIKELRCLSRVSTIIQEKAMVEEVCPMVVQEIVQGMQFPSLALVQLELGGSIFYSEEPFEATPYELSAPIRVRGDDLGRITVYYREQQSFLLPDEQDLLKAIAERLGLWYHQIKTQERLTESERWFRNAIMQAPNPIMIHTVDGEVVEVNDVWLSSTGYAHEEIGTVENWMKLAHPDRYQEIGQMIIDNYENETTDGDRQYPVRTRDGITLYWYFTSAPLGLLPDGRMMVITTAVDITDRVLAEEEKQRYYNRIIALREIDQMMVSTLELDKVLDQITLHLGNVIQIDATSVLLNQGDNLRVIACQGFDNPEEILSLRFPSRPGYPNYDVIEGNKPVMLLNVSEDYPKFIQPGDSHLGGEIKAWLGVPLNDQNEVIGMITLDRLEAIAYTDEDIDIAMQFANRAAIAISNAKLFEQTMTDLRKLEILRAVDSAITSSQSLEEALALILEQIQIGLDIDIVVVYRYEEESESLIYVQDRGFRTEGQPEIKVKVGNGYIGKVAETREPIFIPVVDRSGDGDQFPFSFRKEGVISYYSFPMIVKEELQGVIEYLHRSQLDPDEDWVRFAETLTGQAAIAVDSLTLFAEIKRANQDLREAYDATIEGWAHALEIRDKETEGHSRRVVTLTVDIAKVFGFSDEDLVHIRRGVMLHDIGKMGIPDQILHKSGPLDDAEWDVMRQHPDFAYEMLKEIDYLKPALNIPHYHHERWDGSGYPEGMKGDEIPLEARIFAVVDAWDALTSDRPYRNAWSREKTIQYLRDQAEKEFDPAVVEVFLKQIDLE